MAALENGPHGSIRCNTGGRKKLDDPSGEVAAEQLIEFRYPALRFTRPEVLSKYHPQQRMPVRVPISAIGSKKFFSGRCCVSARAIESAKCGNTPSRTARLTDANVSRATNQRWGFLQNVVTGASKSSFRLPFCKIFYRRLYDFSYASPNGLPTWRFPRVYPLKCSKQQ